METIHSFPIYSHVSNDFFNFYYKIVSSTIFTPFYISNADFYINLFLHLLTFQTPIFI